MLPAVDPIVSPINTANSSPESTLDDDPLITPATTTQFDHSESIKSPFRAYPGLDGFSRSRPTHRRIMSMTERLDEDAIMDDDEEAADSMENREMESRGGWSLTKGQTVEYPMDSKRAPDPCSPSPSRPSLVHRQSSYSKRHASLDTPREVPFPFPLLSRQSDLPGPRVHHSVTAPHETSSPQPPQNILPCSELQQQQQQQSSPPQEHPPFHRSSSQPTTDVIDAAGLIASDRPPAYQKVDEHRPGPGLGAPLANFAPAPQPSSHPPIPLLAPSSPPVMMDPVNMPDLPLPAGSSAAPRLPEASITSPAAITGSDVAAAAPSVATVATPIFPFGRPVSSPSATTPPSLPPSRLQPADPTAPHWYDRTSTASLPLPTHTPLHTLPSLRTRQTPEPIAEVVPTPTLAPPQRQSLPIPPPPSATGRAQPVPRPLSSSVSSVSPYIAPPPPYSVHTGSGMGRSTADYSPVVPARVRAAAASPTAASHSLPPPAPPTILGPPTPSAGTAHRAAHESFLSDAPPPPDSWIAVETFPREYNLVVRLPGFRRDAITLATRRRRILHLVADSWEANGGHFERRISFGYDADLTQVRAEFDGELLRVVVPRRMPGVTWYGDVRE